MRVLSVLVSNCTLVCTENVTVVCFCRFILYVVNGHAILHDGGHQNCMLTDT